MKSLLHWKFIALLLIFSAVTSPLCAESEIDYVVEIKGVDRQDILETLRLLARTITHQDKRAASLIALQLRAEADVERLIQGLQLFAYYSPHIEVEIVTGAPNRLIFNVETGPVFNLARFFLLPATCIPQFEKERALSKSELEEDEGEENIDLIELPRILPSPFDSYSDPNQFQQALHIQLNELGVTLGTPAFPSVILNAEDRLVCYLSQQGYPLSAIIKREVIADHETGEVTVILFLSTGPLAYFGHTKISGNHQVSSRYILNRIRWYYGQRYSPKAVELTSQELEGLGLFKSVEISTETETDASGFLPMEIAVTEGLHRSIGAGVSYDTQQGGGVLFEWENRNVGGRGDQVSLNSDILYKVQKGTLKYTRPDFFSKHRDFLVKLECEHEDTTGFNETSLYFATKILRKFDSGLRFSYGCGYKYLRTTDSDVNKSFSLVKFPVQLLWHNTLNPLDPCDGLSLRANVTSTFHAMRARLSYFTCLFDASCYLRVSVRYPTILALKISSGTIFGASRIDIPPPERLYTGTPTTLRGYNYMTVSPINEKTNKPEGGRSLLVGSIELRTRFTETWGGVLFYELGNVHKETIPRNFHDQLGSGGFGVRYYTALGPLRFDFAFPFNKREGIDKSFQFYFSIGQAF